MNITIDNFSESTTSETCPHINHICMQAQLHLLLSHIDLLIVCAHDMWIRDEHDFKVAISRQPLIRTQRVMVCASILIVSSNLWYRSGHIWRLDFIKI